MHGVSNIKNVMLIVKQGTNGGVQPVAVRGTAVFL
jgi:hypothetical protein